MSATLPSIASPEPLTNTPIYRTAWPWILCVVGLDYMSTLGYVPSIAFDVAGRLAPLAIAGLVLVTVLGALPIYCYIAGRSPHGQGSVAMLERLIPGWLGKLLVLILLGFAATDLIFTRTFSAADAATHILHSPEANWQATLGQWSDQWSQNRNGMPEWARDLMAAWTNKQIVVTVLLLVVGLSVSVVFRKGFRKRFIQIAVVTVVVYMALNAVLIGCGIYYLAENPALVEGWWNSVQAGDWQARSATATGPVDRNQLGATAIELFPRVALGLSGFEMAMVLMPLIRGRPGDDPRRPKGRIRDTRKLLFALALLMCVYMLAASLVTTILIPPEAFRADGQAQNRALAYLAHGGQLAVIPAGDRIAPFFGLTFGTIYDISTVAILSLAGVAVSLSLAEFVPPYLQRLGMEFEWAHKIGVLIYLFAILKIAVTFYYHAHVDAQRSAYTTSVLVIFTTSAFAAALDVWKKRSGRAIVFRFPLWFTAILLAFLLSTIQTIWDRPGGAFMSLWFIGFVLVTSILTRFYRSTELRFKGFDFVDERSREEYEKLKTADFPILVPHRSGQLSIVEKEVEIRKRHRLTAEIPLVFVLVELGDTSEFYLRPLIEIKHEDGWIAIHATRSPSISHALAAIAIDMSRVGVAPEIHFGWSDENPISANLHFVMFGHGNVPWMVYSLLRQSDLPESQRPRVVIG